MTRLPPLRLLRTFEEVARSGSMQEAAARLNVTRPAVTQALKALEDHLGVLLLDRTTRPSRLTDAGRQLAHATRDGLGLISSSIAQIQESAGMGQQLTIACTIGTATHWLMPRLADFYAHHARLVVNVQAPPTDLPSLSLGIDVALRYGTGGWDDGRTWKLFDEIVCPVGHPDLVERLLASEVTPHAAPLIEVRNLDTPHWAGWREYLARIGLDRPSGPIQTFDNYVQAVQAALGGRGLALGWRSITDKLVFQGALTAWPGGDLDLGTGYYATLSQQGEAKTAARAFIDWLMQIRA